MAFLSGETPAIQPLNPYQSFKTKLALCVSSPFQSIITTVCTKLKLLKLSDIYLNNVLIMFKFHHQLLPKAFDNYFQSVSTIHRYNTRLASRSSYYAEPIKTNFGRFSFNSLPFYGWNLAPTEAF